ncbi:MAG: alkaline phosphatase [Bacteroidales bacterium]|jgi:alkaline phosphatase|nr:alkaline phosphatase [Bacteroidales bacterium]
MKIFKFLLILPVICFFTGCHPSAQKLATPAPETVRVRNVILMIGDGMGLAHQYAVCKGNKAVERCQYVGLAKTYSANDYTTDSAAAGTAIACGEKTNNGMLGQRPDSSRLVSMLEYAAGNDLSTGVVVTCELTHATPAAFVAHVNNRNENENIAADYTQSPVNVCIGGGRKYFENRTDSKNLTETMRSKGFRVAYTMDEVKSVHEGNLLALLADVALEPYPARGEMLPEAITAAINILNRNGKGFFLMVEGSQIDWAGHANDQTHLMNEMLDFDRAVHTAFDFAAQDGHTLVIVTADHETGGLTIPGGNLQTCEPAMAFSTKGHTGVPVPVYAFGPDAEMFTGIYDNTAFLPKILNLLGIKK